MGVPSNSHNIKEIHMAIDEFFTTCLLFWVEALAIMGSLDVSIYAVNNVQQWYISVSL